MRKTVVEIRAKYSNARILVGGAPVTMDYCQKIGANFYSPDPQGAVNYLNTIIK
jgi:methanogenic corrinoid protein MtbC1